MDSYDPSPNSLLPTALVVVAVLFIIFGIITILEMIYALTQHRIQFSTGCLGVFVGPGLFRLSRPWRTCGLVLLWISIIVTPIFMLFLLGASRSVADQTRLLGFLIMTVTLVASIWAYRILTRQDIRQLFGLPNA